MTMTERMCAITAEVLQEESDERMIFPIIEWIVHWRCHMRKLSSRSIRRKRDQKAKITQGNMRE